ncbi:MAG TPA: hypothetical protein VFV84_06175, partial [Burkholderiales bacterium]|nr:hypothetical protein [Burkholderiales bacterium]
EVISERLKILKEWKWSSYRAYAGYCEAPPWLTCDVLGQSCGGRSVKERQAALREYTEQAVREGLPESPWERVIGGAVLGTKEFARQVSRKLKANRREQAGAGKLTRAVDWEQIVEAVERVKGEPWEKFRDRHGDWGRDAVLWLGRRIGRMKLSQLAERIGGLDYPAAGAAVSRFNRRLAKDRKLAAHIKNVQNHLSNVEM